MEHGNDHDLVHRPLLFHSKGYESSQLLLDDAYRKHRRKYHDSSDEFLPDEHKLHVVHAHHRDNLLLQGPAAPRLLLETLSSSAASLVLIITYIAFGIAFLLPYLHRSSFLTTVRVVF